MSCSCGPKMAKKPNVRFRRRYHVEVSVTFPTSLPTPLPTPLMFPSKQCPPCHVSDAHISPELCRPYVGAASSENCSRFVRIKDAESKFRRNLVVDGGLHSDDNFSDVACLSVMTASDSVVVLFKKMNV